MCYIIFMDTLLLCHRSYKINVCQPLFQNFKRKQQHHTNTDSAQAQERQERLRLNVFFEDGTCGIGVTPESKLSNTPRFKVN